jgi:hypothetical protein
MLTLSYDICILISGDADMCPAVEAARAQGKQVFVATWNQQDLSQHLRSVAFDHIDLLDGLPAFAHEPSPAPPTTDDSTFLAELKRAQDHFATGYLGQSYFLSKWESPSLPPREQDRRNALDRLIAANKVETYPAPDGTLAIRIKN